MSDSTDILAIRQAEWAALWTCLCKFSGRCTPARQSVARTLSVTPETCLVAPLYAHGSVNPTSRTEDAPF